MWQQIGRDTFKSNDNDDFTCRMEYIIDGYVTKEQKIKFIKNNKNTSIN